MEYPVRLRTQYDYASPNPYSSTLLLRQEALNDRSEDCHGLYPFDHGALDTTIRARFSQEELACPLHASRDPVIHVLLDFCGVFALT
jgi:hypothetical protein